MLKTINLSNFNTASLTKLDGMFKYCTRLETVILGKDFK